MAKKKTKMGRPVLGDKGKVERVAFRVTKAEFNALEKQAKQEGITIGQMLLGIWKNKRS